MIKRLAFVILESGAKNNQLLRMTLVLNYKLRSYFSMFSVLGVGLIHEEENPKAQVCNNIVSMVYIVICAVLLLQWVGLKHGTMSKSVCEGCDWLIWTLFLGCYVLLITVVDDIKRFLLTNWLLPVVLVLGLGLLIENDHITGYLLDARIDTRYKQPKNSHNHQRSYYRCP